MFERNPRVTSFAAIALAVVISCLLSASAVAQDLDGPSSLDWKLLLASEKGDVKEVRIALDLGASPLCHDEVFGGTPLHWAAYKGHVKAVEVLLNRGGAINALNKEGRTAFILAAAMGQVPVVKFLLERGADPAVKGLDGRDAEDWAKHWHRTAVLRLLHPDAAQAEEKSQQEKPRKETRRQSVKRQAPTGPEHMNRALVSAVKKGLVDKAKRLLNDGADPNAFDKTSRTSVLILAVRGGKDDIVSLLLEKGANPNVRDEARSTTPLMEASEKGLLPVVMMLLDKGADPNAVGPGSRTALIVAAQEGKTDAVAMLVEAKADVNTTDDTGKTALQWAVKNGRTATAGWLLKHQEAAQAVPEPTSPDQKTAAEPAQAQTAPETGQMATAQPAEANLPPAEKNKALIEAAGNGALEDVERLIRAGADVEAKDDNGTTPLLAAATKGAIEVAESLLKSKANVNATNAAGLTPLAVAVESGHTAVAELLIKYGADVNAKSGDGTTVLGRADRKGSQDLQALLRQHGATVPEAQTVKDQEPRAQPQPAEVVAPVAKKPEPVQETKPGEDKNKALFDAAQKGDMENVQRLLDAGADVNAKGAADLTVLMAAATSGNLEVVKLLVERGANVNAKDPSGKTALAYGNEKGAEAVSAFLQSRTAPAAKPQPQEVTKVTADEVPAGKHRIRAISPETQSASQAKPK